MASCPRDPTACGVWEKGPKMHSLPSLDLTRLRQSCCLGFSSHSAPPFPVEIPLQLAGGGCDKKLLSGGAAGEAAVRTDAELLL